MRVYKRAKNIGASHRKRPLLEVKQTSRFDGAMSAYDPKRTLRALKSRRPRERGVAFCWATAGFWGIWRCAISLERSVIVRRLIFVHQISHRGLVSGARNVELFRPLFCAALYREQHIV